MKIAAISDLHGHLIPADEMPEADVLCICGDIVPLNYQRSLVRSVSWFAFEFVPWVDSLPYEKVFFVGGNHDFFLEDIMYGKDRNRQSTYMNDADDVLSTLMPDAIRVKHKKLVYLCDNIFIYKGVKFYGSPWISALEKWAFYKTDEDLAKVWESIPYKVDVLITHMPSSMASTGTVLQHGAYNMMASYGSEVLTEAIQKRKIKYAICGHVHSGNHNPEKIDYTVYANVSIKDENYKLSYEPLVFEV